MIRILDFSTNYDNYVLRTELPCPTSKHFALKIGYEFRTNAYWLGVPHIAHFSTKIALRGGSTTSASNFWAMRS